MCRSWRSGRDIGCRSGACGSLTSVDQGVQGAWRPLSAGGGQAVYGFAGRRAKIRKNVLTEEVSEILERGSFSRAPGPADIHKQLFDLHATLQKARDAIAMSF